MQPSAGTTIEISSNSPSYGSVVDLVNAEVELGKGARTIRRSSRTTFVQEPLRGTIKTAVQIFEVSFLLVLAVVLLFTGSGHSSLDHSTMSLVGSKNIASSASTSKSLLPVSGFQNSDITSEKHPDGHFHWYNAPDTWKPEEGKREGRDGAWSVDDSTKSLTITPPAKKDYWRKTYYEPILVKDDGPFLYSVLPSNQHYTIETAFDLTAVQQFDQAGIMIRLGPEHWLKTGIEVVDQQPRLSCVVTNGYSDWSTQSWSNYTIENNSGDDGIRVHVNCQIRVHCRGDSFVVEASLPDSSKSGEPRWQFIRIAHLDTVAEKDDLMVGVFAASPEDQQGGQVVFRQFSAKEGSQFDHNADGNHET